MDRKKEYEISISKPVIQYTYDGIKIKEFPSIRKAMDETKINNINKACDGVLKSAGGYLWRFQNDTSEVIPFVPHECKNKPVTQYTKDLMLINEFPSLKEASAITNISFQSISACCRGKLKSAGGYVWKFRG